MVAGQARPTVRQGNRTPRFEPLIDEVIDVGHLIADLSAQVRWAG